MALTPPDAAPTERSAAAEAARSSTPAEGTLPPASAIYGGGFPWKPLLFAILAPTAATAFRWAAIPWLGNFAELALFPAIILLSALYGGLWAGLTTMAISMALGWNVLLKFGNVAAATPRIVGLCIVGTLLSIIGHYVRLERRRAAVRDRELQRALHDSRQAQLASAMQARVLESMAEGVLIFDGDGNLTFTNAALDRMFGCRSGELLGSLLIETLDYPEDERRRRFEAIMEQVGRVGSWEGELQQRRRNGERFFTRVRIASLPTGDGRSCVCVQEDVTERRRADEAVHDANRRLQQRVEELATLLEVLPVGIGIASDPECRDIQVNSAFAKLLHLERGANASLSAPEHDRPKAFRIFRNGVELTPDELPMQKAAQQGVATHDQELDIVFADDSVVRLLEYAVPLFDENGRTRGSIGAFVDITDRRAAEQERERLVGSLTQRTEKLVLLSQAVRDVNEYLDADAVLRTLIRAALQITDSSGGTAGLRHDQTMVFREYRRGDTLVPIDLTFHADDRYGTASWVLRNCQTYIANDAAADEVVRPDLREQYGIVNLLNLPIMGRGDELLGCFELHNKPGGFTPQDCVKLQTLAAGAAIALENARLFQKIREADRRKDDFLAMLAHELRNPMAPLRSALDYLALSESSDDTLRQLREIMDRQVTHMGRIIDDLLDVARISRGRIELRPEVLDLTSVVRDVVDSQAGVCETGGVTLSAELPAEPVWAEADETRLAQVLANLISNAQKFTEAGGSITVRLRHSPGRDEAEISVADTGIGISAVDLPRVFDIFSQADRSLDRSRGGLGLGLALVKGIVELHGGRAIAESGGIGRGSTFTVYLPAAAVGPTARKVPRQPVESVGRLQVLIVEDNRDAALTLNMVLQREGHNVTVVHSGAEGVAAAVELRPDVIVCDIGLPGMNGYAVVEAIRANPLTAGARILALSGYGREEDRARAFEAGFDEHFTKPADTATIVRWVTSAAVVPNS